MNSGPAPPRSSFIIHRSYFTVMFLYLLRATRPSQWIKNLLLYAGFLFTLGAGHAGTSFARASLGAVLFCCLSACSYLVNDVLDMDADRRNPAKRNRPVAAGTLPPGIAFAVAMLFGLVGLVGSYAADGGFGYLAAIYMLLTLSYSALLKRIVLLDVIVLAMGYVVRAVAGAVIVGVPASFWLALCTMLLALFLGLCKRRAELVSGEGEHREVMSEYSLPLLDQMISVVTASALLAYALYTYFTPTLHPNNRLYLTEWRFEHHLLTFTIPFVVYGIYRYLYLVYRRDEGGSPEELFLHDRPLMLNTVLWALACAAALFASRLSGI